MIRVVVVLVVLAAVNVLTAHHLTPDNSRYKATSTESEDTYQEG
jgi:hypothetical protein